jgi:hypothetical protein
MVDGVASRQMVRKRENKRIGSKKKKKRRFVGRYFGCCWSMRSESSTRQCNYSVA